MNVAIVTPQMIIGGAEQYIITKSKWLVENGHDVIIISEGGENVKNLPNKVRHFQLEKISQPTYLFKYGRLLEMYYQLSRILKDERIDIVEAHNTWPIIHVIGAYKLSLIHI